MHESISGFNFKATGVGSVPFQDTDGTCLEILEYLPHIPYWPQFVKRTYLEDMYIQFSEGIPLLETNRAKRSLHVSQTRNAESELVTFYDHFMTGDIDYFAVSREYAMGLYTLLELIERDSFDCPYIKGQTVGPITFAAGITDTNGNSLLHNPELLEAVVNGIAIKALWQVVQLSRSGKKTVIFLDEPFLSGFGSAFTTIERDAVIHNLKVVIDYLRKNSETLIGIHCCGNTDWSMIVESDPDIINFDAFEYMDYFLLYPDDIKRFLNKGGTIAWGIIPTANFTGSETVEELYAHLQQGFDRICDWGVAPDILAERSLITPACGMGTMPTEHAKRNLDLLSRLSLKFSQ